MLYISWGGELSKGKCVGEGKGHPLADGFNVE